MSSQTVLLTGINGFLAIQIAKILLERGYNVVGTVRSPSKTDYIKTYFKDSFDHGRLDFAVVEDITQDGAFDTVLKSRAFNAVIHTSSPFNFTALNPEEDLLKPAIKGTTSLLSSIHHLGRTVTRVVITSSFASVCDFAKGLRPGYTYKEDDWNSVTYEEGCKNSFVGYFASKKLAEEAAWEFVKSTKPSFSLTTICPPIILGPPEQEVTAMDKLNTSSTYLYEIFTGKAREYANSGWTFTHVKDTALAHVQALESKSAINQRYIVVAGPYFVQEILDFIWKHYPERAERLNIPKTGQPIPEGGVFAVDHSKSEKDLGLRYSSFDETLSETFNKFEELEKVLR